MTDSTSLPVGWASSTMGEVCAPSQYGYTAKAGSSGNAHFLRTTDITSGAVNWNAVPWCTVLDEELKKYLLRDGDVVISRAGSIGFSYLVREPKRSVFASYLIRFRPLIDARYFSYFLQTPSYWASIGEQSLGIAVQNVNASRLSEIELPVAPLLEQERIVEKLEELLSDLDTGVAELKAAQRKLAQYRQSLLKAAVEGTLTADWRAAHGKPQETGAELLQRILSGRRARWEQKQLAKFAAQGKAPSKGWQAKYPDPVAPNLANLPPLPEGWIWASLDMLGEIASGVAKGTKRAANIRTREVPYLRVANVQRGYLDLTQVKTIEATENDIAELRLVPGDVLFNEGGDLDKPGRGWVWYGELSECIHQNHVFRMRPILPATPSELISHRGNTFGKEWFKSAGKQTTNLASINMTMLRAFPVPVPPELEAREILARLEPMLSATVAQGKDIERGLILAVAQRKNILEAAFTGQLVLQDPNDEPASELLVRIRAKRTAKFTKGRKPQSMVRKTK